MCVCVECVKWAMLTELAQACPSNRWWFWVSLRNTKCVWEMGRQRMETNSKTKKKNAMDQLWDEAMWITDWILYEMDVNRSCFRLVSSSCRPKAAACSGKCQRNMAHTMYTCTPYKCYIDTCISMNVANLPYIRTLRCIDTASNYS